MLKPVVPKLWPLGCKNDQKNKAIPNYIFGSRKNAGRLFKDLRRKKTSNLYQLGVLTIENKLLDPQKSINFKPI